MSLCLVAMVVLGILGIFSAKYRRWAKESFACVTRRLILKPCDTGFDQRVKAKIISRFSSKPKLARFTHKHFEAISWIFTIVLFVSLIYTGYSVYNLAVHGSCNPDSGQCVFNPDLPECGHLECTGEGCNCVGEECPDTFCPGCNT